MYYMCVYICICNSTIKYLFCLFVVVVVFVVVFVKNSCSFFF